MKKFFTYDPSLLFYGFAIIFFASFGQTFFISIFNLEIRNAYNLSDGEFGLVYALGTLSSSLILVIFARLIDQLDLRLYTFIISSGLAIACAGMYIGYNSIIYLFFVIFGLRFFGQGAMGHAGDTTMSRYFGSNRGKAISIANFGGQIGLMFLPIIAVKFLFAITWQYVWLLASMSILLIFLPLLFFLLNNQRSRHINFIENSSEFRNKRKMKTRELLLDRKFYIYLPISISASFIGTGLMFHQVFIINQKNWTLEMLANGYILLGIFSIVGLTFGGIFVDKFNTRKVVIFSLLPLFLSIVTLLIFDSYLSMFIYLSLIGLNMGIGSPIIGSLWSELYGLESIGTVKALLHAVGVFASSLSPVIFGYMIDGGLGIYSISFLSLLIILFSISLAIIHQKS